MKLALTFIASLATAQAFVVAPQSKRTSTLLRSTESVSSVDVSTVVAKTELLEVAQDLNREFGCLIIDSAAQEKLRAAVETLEAVTEPPQDTAELVGNWTLLCSTASSSVQNGPLDRINGIDTTKLPFFNEGPLKEIRDTINKSLKVQQLIKTTEEGVIDRVDHVLQYMPPDTLSAFAANIPDTLKNLDINPLKVSNSKVILVHKAEVEEGSVPISTKLSLSSFILNVAGKSQILDPNGADIASINVPFGEFLNAGATFETTYMDDKIRISRSKTGIVDQLRVFLKSELEVEAPAEVVDELEEEDDIKEADIVDEDDVSPSDY